jgi:hypothetical protein
MKTMKTLMTELYGEKGMRRPARRDELYQAIDIITETCRAHKQRLDALEGQKGVKPRYRVPAETRSM